MPRRRVAVLLLPANALVAPGARGHVVNAPPSLSAAERIRRIDAAALAEALARAGLGRTLTCDVAHLVRRLTRAALTRLRWAGVRDRFGIREAGELT